MRRIILGLFCFCGLALAPACATPLDATLPADERRSLQHEALLVIEQSGKQNIDLLITDLIMPRMGGKELAARMQVSHPKTKILFISGYTGELIIRQGELDPCTDFLQKPFIPSILARKVREILDGRKKARR